MVLDSAGNRTSRAETTMGSTDAYPDGLTNGASKPSTYTIQERPLGTPKQLRIVAVGAGASGLNLIRTLRLHLTNFDLVVYEKNASVGGTWLENRYPGCRCDIPSHNYQFSWRPNPEWSNFHSPGEEIGRYLEQVCLEQDMGRDIRLSHKIENATWNEETGKWQLQVSNMATGESFEDSAHFLLDASGILNQWRWPDVPDVHAFQGDLIHTASWPKDFDYQNKTVAVIGNGSSGTQVLPAIQPAVKKLYHIARSPSWVVPPRIMSWKMLGQAKEALASVEMDEQENFSPAQIEKFKSDPEYYRAFVKGIEKELNTFAIILKDGPVQAFARQKVTEYMTAMLGGNAKLCKALIPDYALGCRRMTPAPGYLMAMTQPNVEVLSQGIKRFVPEGIEMQSGGVIKVDAIICATGFDVSFTPRFPIVGRNGNLQNIWSENDPKAYMSCAVPGLPNYFSPNGPAGHGSIFTASEHIAKYVTGVIKKCQTEDIKSISPSQAAVDDYSEHIASFMPRTAWASSGRSWFKRGESDGPVTALHPGSRIHFFHMLENFRGEDWEYTYDGPSGNRFAYLGNGFSTKELDPRGDATWYLDQTDSLLW